MLDRIRAIALPKIIRPKGEPQLIFVVRSWHLTLSRGRLACGLPVGEGGLRQHGRALLSQIDEGDICPRCVQEMRTKILTIHLVMAGCGLIQDDPGEM